MEQQCSASAVHSQRTNMARAVAQDVENEVAKSVENVFVKPEKNEDNMKPEENDTATDIPIIRTSPWTCTHCDFGNPTSTPKCEICSNAAPATAPVSQPLTTPPAMISQPPASPAVSQPESVRGSNFRTPVLTDCVLLKVPDDSAGNIDLLDVRIVPSNIWFATLNASEGVDISLSDTWSRNNKKESSYYISRNNAMWHDGIAKLVSNAKAKVRIKLPPMGTTVDNGQYAYTVEEQKMRVYAELLRRHKPWVTAIFLGSYQFDNAGDLKLNRLSRKYPGYLPAARKAQKMTAKEVQQQKRLLWLKEILGDKPLTLSFDKPLIVVSTGEPTECAVCKCLAPSPDKWNGGFDLGHVDATKEHSGSPRQPADIFYHVVIMWSFRSRQGLSRCTLTGQKVKRTCDGNAENATYRDKL